MSVFYKTMISDSCLDVIRQGYTPGLSQDGDGVDDIVMDAIPTMVLLGSILLYHEGNIVYMLRRSTAWIGIVDIFIGENGTIKEAIKVGRKAIAWAVENTYYHKLEARSPMPAMPVIAKRIGFKVEGFREHSFKTQSGEMLDEVEVGLILRSASCHKSH